MSTFRSALLVLLTTLALVGCAAKERPFIVWPLPPDQPRVQFLGNYSSQDDFEKSGFQVFAEGFLGKPPLAFFKTPFGIAVDSRDLVYVSDIHARTLRVYDMKAKTVNYYLKDSPFAGPRGLDVDAADQLYVADLTDKHILVFSPDRVLLRTIGAGILSTPVGVAVTPDGRTVYVADSGKSQILALDGIDGKLLRTYGEKEGTASLASPQGVAIGPDGHLYVADTLNARIAVFATDGQFLRSFGVRGDRPHEFEGPKDLAFDSEGHLWVPDTRGGRVGIFDRESGRLFLSIGDTRRSGAALGFGTPTGIFIDRNNRVYIADGTNRRFGVWQYFSEAYIAEHPLSAEELKKLDPYIKKNQEAIDAAAKAAK